MNTISIKNAILCNEYLYMLNKALLQKKSTTFLKSFLMQCPLHIIIVVIFICLCLFTMQVVLELEMEF